MPFIHTLKVYGIQAIFSIMLKWKAKDAYLELKKRTDKEALAILSSFERVKNILKDNPQYGDPINKELIPKELKSMGIQNLYRVELSNYWRMLYTIEGNNVEIFLFILSISDHNDYNKLFKYKGL
jgi:mRNA-degrading endonuclease RelE of RelBE toxin-antitoxin system